VPRRADVPRRRTLEKSSSLGIPSPGPTSRRPWGLRLHPDPSGFATIRATPPYDAELARENNRPTLEASTRADLAPTEEAVLEETRSHNRLLRTWQHAEPPNSAADFVPKK
jgi:hypothetical protein